MKKTKTSLRNAQAELKIAKENYENKLREFNQLEQQAQIAQNDGDGATARQLMKQAIDVEAELSELQTRIRELEAIINQPQKNNLIPLLALIPIALILVGGGILINKWVDKPQVIQPTPSTQTSCLPSGTKLRINGSTSMAQINKKLKDELGNSCPDVSLEIAANGSEIGIRDLLAGKIDVAAVSRPLTTQEESQGLTSVIAREDAIAVMVNQNNPFQGGLTSTQLADIFKGSITNWSAVGGTGGTIRVINRSKDSGTRKAFKELILKEADFGTAPNITTHNPDETTGIIKKLGTDGISYASYVQVMMKTVRIVPIDNLMPDSPTYPIKRQLRYVYKVQQSPAVKAFFDYLNTPKAKEAIKEATKE
jgi:phosphate transport system substrate-binding protein